MAALSTGSSEKHSKLRPPTGCRWMFTVGASSTRTPLSSASSPSTSPISRTRSRSQVAARAVADRHAGRDLAPATSPDAVGSVAHWTPSRPRRVPCATTRRRLSAPPGPRAVLCHSRATWPVGDLLGRHLCHFAPLLDRRLLSAMIRVGVLTRVNSHPRRSRIAVCLHRGLPSSSDDVGSCPSAAPGGPSSPVPPTWRGDGRRSGLRHSRCRSSSGTAASAPRSEDCRTPSLRRRPAPTPASSSTCSTINAYSSL